LKFRYEKFLGHGVRSKIIELVALADELLSLIDVQRSLLANNQSSQ